MKIALIGAHNTGKTSLFNKMYSSITFEGHEFFPEVIRDVHRFGFSINEDSDDPAQLAMCAMHLNHLKTTNFVTDRCLLDNLAYARVLSKIGSRKVSIDCVDIIDTYFKKTKDLIDLYIYCPIYFEMQSDGIRTVDKDFQKTIDNEIIKVLHYISPNKIFGVTGDTNERFKQVIQKVNSLGIGENK